MKRIYALTMKQGRGKCTPKPLMSMTTSVTRRAILKKPVIAANFPGSAIKVVPLSERMFGCPSTTKDELHSRAKLPSTEKETAMQQLSCSYPAGSIKIRSTSTTTTGSEPSLYVQEAEPSKLPYTQTSPQLCRTRQSLNHCPKGLEAKCLLDGTGTSEASETQNSLETQNNDENMQPSKKPAFWISFSIPEILATLPTATHDQKEAKSPELAPMGNGGCSTGSYDSNAEEVKTCLANTIKDKPSQGSSTDGVSRKHSATEAEMSATCSGFPSTAFKISPIPRKSNHRESDDHPRFKLEECTDIDEPKNDFEVRTTNDSTPQEIASPVNLTKPNVMTLSLLSDEETFLSEMDVEGLLGDRKGRHGRNRRRRSRNKSGVFPKLEPAASFSFAADVEALLLEGETERCSRKRKKSHGRSSGSSTTTDSGPVHTHSGCESNLEDNNPVKPKGKKRGKVEKLHPNAFVSVRIPSVQIREKLKEVQDVMMSYDRKLKSTFVPLEKLHLTLMVLRLEDTEMVEKAKAVLEEATKTVAADLHLHANLLVLEFTGVGSFGKRVVFASIKEGESKERLSATAEVVQSVFESYGLPSTDKRPFNPHLTIAKVSQNSRKGVNQIKEHTYEEFTDFEFGSEQITGLELLSMTEPKSADGYYHCFQRCMFAEP